mgnify:CR=1 FL=1
MTKHNYDIAIMQREALAAVYKEVYPKCWNQGEIWEKVARHPAPRYYITAKEAYEKLRRMAVGDNSIVDKLGSSKRRLYYSLFERMQELTQRREYINKSLWFLSPIIVSQPAPEFFLEPRTVKDILVKCRRYGKNFRHVEVYNNRLKNKACTDDNNSLVISHI